MGGCHEVKNHPWFDNFDWDQLQRKLIKPTFVPDIKQQNFDNGHVNLKQWNDTDEVLEHSELLRRPSQKVVFETYYFNKN